MHRLTRIDKKHWIAIMLAFLFTAVFFWLNSRQYLAFQMRAPDAATGDAQLDLALYDSYSLERVIFDNGQELLHLFEVQLAE